MRDTDEYGWLDAITTSTIRGQFDLPDQIRAIAVELTAERGFVLSAHAAFVLVALAIIATPLSLTPEGQAEFIRRYILRSAWHSAEQTGRAATEGNRRDLGGTPRM
jgi:hypothetical protein